MQRTLLFLCILVLGCDDPNRPPTIPGTGTPPPGIGTGGGDRDGGPDGSLDGGEDGGVDGGEPGNTIVCEDASPPQNQAALSIPFTPSTAYALWSPDACATVRQLVVGLDSNQCGLATGALLQVGVDAAKVADGTITANSALEISTTNGLAVRFIRNNGNTWGNCFGASGPLRYTALSLTPGETVSVDLAPGMVLTDCGGRALADITAAATITITVPPGCDEDE